MVKCDRLIAALIALAPVGAGARAAVADSMLQQVQNEQYVYVNNICQGSANPTSLAATPLRQLAVVRTGYGWCDGDYHSPDAGRGTDGFFVEAKGLQRMTDVVCEGFFSYRNLNERSGRFNSTLYQSPLNPFVLADSLRSDYNKELFHIAGRVAWSATRRLRIGLNADYHVGVKSDESDPRLEAKGMRFILNPGIEADFGTVSAGLTAGINLLNETEQYSSLNSTVVHRFFLMEGLGVFFPQSGIAYTRDVKGTSWFAEPSVRLRLGRHSADFLSIRFDAFREKAVDGGSSYRFLGGDWSDNCFSLYDRFSFTKGVYSHNIEIRCRYDDSKGVWYEQRAYTDNGTTRYEVMNSSVKHKQTMVRVSAGYRLDRLDSSLTPSFTAAVTAGFESMDATNYPERFTRKISHAVVSAEVMKRWICRNVVLRFKADAGWRERLSSSLNATGLELYDKYTLPMYAFAASSSLNVRGSVCADVPVGKMMLGAEVYGGSSICTRSVDAIYRGMSSDFAGACVKLYF